MRIGQTPRETAQEHIDELEELRRLPEETVIKFSRTRQRLDSAFMSEKESAHEILDLIEPNEIDLIVFDDDLSMIQVRNLSNLFDKKVIDKADFILDYLPREHALKRGQDAS
ncbi:MAG: hypothetical protein IPJ75_16290 [Ignavibacteriales bacterium]|nr:hypothetical protein [Ignavibacteriales bacterium]